MGEASGDLLTPPATDFQRGRIAINDLLPNVWLRVVAIAVVAAALAAVGASAWSAPHSAARLTVRSTEYGKALFGPSGKVVYVFDADRRSTSRCYGVCAKAWPPLLTKDAPRAGQGVEAKLLGTTRRRDGTLQVTYNRHPLYYYSADHVGKVMCQHAVMHGGLWLIIKPSGQPNTAKGKMMQM
jgi:predicted lipoprotein with Yx(FWY)xxD motif